MRNSDVSLKLIWEEIKSKLKIILVMVLILTLPTPLIMLILIPSLLVRFIVKICAKLFRRDLTNIYGGIGGPLMALEGTGIFTHPKFNILVHMYEDALIPVEEYRHGFEERVLNLKDGKGEYVYRKLRQIWTPYLGFYFWKWDPDFDLRNHIREYDYTEPELALPSPCTRQDIERVTGEWIARPWPRGRSPWEILFIQNVVDPENPEKRFTCYSIRIHHAMADGFSIIKMLLKAADSEEVKVPTANFTKLPLWERVLRPLIIGLKTPYDISKTIVESFDGPNSWHLVGTKYERKYHVFHSDKIPVEKFKEIRRKYNVGYNAAVYAVAVGCVRRMMIAAGQKLPKSMGCFVPFPLPRHPGGLTVHVTFVCFKFSPRLESAEERMKEIAQNFASLQKAPTVPIINGLALRIVSALPICFMRLIYNKMMMSVGMTNFPGPESEAIYKGVCGSRATMTDLVFTIGHNPGNLGAVGTMISYAGKQSVVFTIDKKIFENYTVPENFPQLINDEIEALLAAKDSYV